MKRDDGGPAFPVVVNHLPELNPDMGSEIVTEHPGMSLRDWFAGQALAGLSAQEGIASSTEKGNPFHEKDAIRCYAIADALIAKRR